MQRQGWYIGYMRVSTQEQARHGVGLKAQRRALEAWAERQGVELRLLYERGCSGKRGAKRPKLDAALASLHAKDGPEGLVVAKLDRLSRSTVDFGLVLEKAQKRGWRVVLLDMDVDTSTPQGEMLAGMLVVAAQFERRLIALRTKDALAVKKAQGVHCGRSSTLELDTRRRILGDKARGFSNANIARSLNEDLVPTGQGGKRWHASTVGYVLRRAS
jgi:DNA invertase Pin-like site-specific DNA recombinase